MFNKNEICLKKRSVGINESLLFNHHFDVIMHSPVDLNEVGSTSTVPIHITLVPIIALFCTVRSENF